MKLWKQIINIILIALTSIVVYFSANLIFSVISNYDSISLVSLAGLPMYMLVASLISLGFYTYKAHFKGLNDAFAKRHYAVLILSFSAIGLIGSILNGTLIYHTFVGPYVFPTYPLLMLLISILEIVGAIYTIFKAQKEIKTNNLICDRKSNLSHILKTIGLVCLTFFAFERLGALLTIPLYWSSYDSIYVVPYYVQLAVPFAVLACYLAYRDLINKNFKFGLISTSIILGYSLFSLIYMLVLKNNNVANAPLYINGLSSVQNLERLLKIPVNFIIMYAVSSMIPLANVAVMVIRKIVKK